MSAATCIPDSLLILVHLHLLNYPLKDAAGYDEHLFDPHTNGMRERVKAMEDICYFLVGKVQGSREHAKAILPTYPCLQPSDSTAFRMSLAKHLETLRHGIVYPSHADMKPNTMSKKSQAKATTVASAANAWWWKDVVVRRSILEECCGERFERLLLSMSTHALLKTMPTATIVSVTESSDLGHAEVVAALSQTYTLLLSSAQSDRRAWERSASLLVQRQSELWLLREQLTNPDPTFSSKYDSLSTNRLLALHASRLQDLLRKYWKRQEGQRGLHFLTDLAGLEISPNWSVRTSSCEVAPESGFQDVSKTAVPHLPSPPLPIAAAHHPTRLRALNLPLFSATFAPTNQIGGPVAVTEDPVTRSAAERVDAATRIHQALQDALVRAEGVRKELKARLESLQAARPSKQPTGGKAMPLWENSARRGVNFQTAPTPALLGAFGLPPPPHASVLEARIADIRSTELPAFQPIQSVATSDAAPPVSRLRQPSDKGSWHDGPSSKTGVYKMREKGPVMATEAHTESPHLKQPSPRKSSHAHTLSSTRRASRRPSTKRARRSTAAVTRKTSLDREVDRILDTVHDSDEFTVFDDVASTPMRTGTAGVPLSSAKKCSVRRSFDIEKHERVGAKLPALRLSDAQEESEDRETEEWTDDEPQALEDVEEDEEEFYGGRSVTLKDILLGASGDVTQFNLLGADNLGDESFEWE